MSRSHSKIPRPEGDLWRACATPLLKEDSLKFQVWKDEVHHLLIFAGLFSSVVTAFVVQTYEGLGSESPPTASCIRVNVCWFLSLTLSLITVLFGVVTLQWLREFEHYRQTLPSKDILARRTMHHESFDTWLVPHIFTSLPLLLNAALLLFFSGLFDFLWQLNSYVAVPCGVLISFAFLFLIITTTMPTIQSLWLINSSSGESPPSQCPYKSPQSWAFLRLMASAPVGAMLNCFSSFCFLSCWILIAPFRWINCEYILDNLIDRMATVSRLECLGMLKDWKMYDDFWLDERQRAGTHQSSSRFFTTGQSCVDFDAARGLAYVTQTQSQNPNLTLPLYHCFHELPPSVINDTTFDIMLQSLPDQIKLKKTSRITSVALNPPDDVIQNENELFLISRLPRPTSVLLPHTLEMRQVELFIGHITYLIVQHPRIRVVQDNTVTIPRLLIPRCLRSGPAISNLTSDVRNDICSRILTLFKALVLRAAMTNSEDWSNEICSSEEFMGDFFQVVHSATLGRLSGLQATESDDNPTILLKEALEMIFQRLSEDMSTSAPVAPFQAYYRNHSLFYLGKIYISRISPEMWSTVENSTTLNSALKNVVLILRQYEVKSKRWHYFEQHHALYSERWHNLLRRLDVQHAQETAEVTEPPLTLLPSPIPPAYFYA